MTENRIEDLTGRLKEAAGDITGDEKLKREGQIDQASASVKQKIGEVADSLKEIVNPKTPEHAGDAVESPGGTHEPTAE